MILEKHKISTGLILGFMFLAYSFFLYSDLPVSHVKSSQSAKNGKMLWQNKNCISCHQIYGLGGYLGPDLTNTFSKKGPQYIKAFLKSGTDIMPNFHLTENEIKDLTAFLEETDASGSSDPQSFIINYNGTIEQKRK